MELFLMLILVVCCIALAVVVPIGGAFLLQLVALECFDKHLSFWACFGILFLISVVTGSLSVKITRLDRAGRLEMKSLGEKGVAETVDSETELRNSETGFLGILALVATSESEYWAGKATMAKVVWVEEPRSSTQEFRGNLVHSEDSEEEYSGFPGFLETEDSEEEY